MYIYLITVSLHTALSVKSLARRWRWTSSEQSCVTTKIHGQCHGIFDYLEDLCASQHPRYIYSRLQFAYIKGTKFPVVVDGSSVIVLLKLKSRYGPWYQDLRLEGNSRTTYMKRLSHNVWRRWRECWLWRWDCVQSSVVVTRKVIWLCLVGYKKHTSWRLIGIFLQPWRINGRISVQSRLTLMDSKFSMRWNRSTRPFDCDCL